MLSAGFSVAASLVGLAPNRLELGVDDAFAKMLLLGVLEAAPPKRPLAPLVGLGANRLLEALVDGVPLEVAPNIDEGLGASFDDASAGFAPNKVDLCDTLVSVGLLAAPKGFAAGFGASAGLGKSVAAG